MNPHNVDEIASGLVEGDYQLFFLYYICDGFYYIESFRRNNASIFTSISLL